MKTIVSKISNEFLQEAISSPRMLEDLAAMERYMAESYDGRAFVEMLQNADDAGAKRIAVFSCDDTIIFANDGRPFNENDMAAICRSGMSSKERGAGIGYRGVGFKSATSISTEIIVYSAGAFFSFSKSLCARNLKMPENRVPTVRIPFPVDEKEIAPSVRIVLEEHKQCGFTTFFIFNHGNREKIMSELKTVDDGWLIFLNNVSEISISFEHITKKLSVLRSNTGKGYSRVKIGNGRDHWIVVSDEDTSLAFRFDIDEGIVPCMAESALFHCYLPTMDAVGFAFKANADFSTDPSRKHIILNDKLSEIAFKRLACLVLKFIAHAVTDERLVSMLGLLCSHVGLSEAGAAFERELLSALSEEAWVPLVSGRRVLPKEVKRIPEWFDGKNAQVIQNKVLELRSLEVDPLLSNVGKINQLLSACGSKTYDVSDYFVILRNVDAMANLDVDFIGKLWGYTYRESHYAKEGFESCYIPLANNQIGRIADLGVGKELPEKFIKGISDVLRSDEIRRLVQNVPVLSKLDVVVNVQESKRKPRTAVIPQKGKVVLSKYKTPVQNCVASEMILNNQAKDVSRRNCGYDVESTTPSGEPRFIVAKNVHAIGDSFVLTDKEYDAAKQLGSAYYVFVVCADAPETQHVYIKNPAATKLEKRVKEWEWVCLEYEVSCALDCEKQEQAMV